MQSELLGTNLRSMKNCCLALLILLGSSLFAQTQNERLFIFGHSLIDHRPPAIATPSDETTVPHWLHLFAQEAGHTIAAGGQYGFLPFHRANIINDEVEPQWGYDIVPGVWDIDNETFAEANMTSVMLTLGNFMQNDLLPTDDYYNEPAGVTPISTTEYIFNWVEQQEPGTRYFIYENWPETNLPVLNPTYPISQTQFDVYNAYTQGGFHDWWIDLHDAVLANRPDLNVRMIPVGPTLAKLFESNLADQIPYTELYEDLDPHGRATLYFLAAMVTYAAIYQEQPPAGFVVPTIIHEDVRNNYAAISTTIWNELQAFNTDAGESRVFSNGTLPVSLASFTGKVDKDKVVLNWTTSSESGTDRFVVERQSQGAFTDIGDVAAAGTPNDYQFIDNEPSTGINLYRLRIIDQDDSATFSSVITLENAGSTSLKATPRGSRQFQLSGLEVNSDLILINGNGQTIFQVKGIGPDSLVELPAHFPPGVYYLMASNGKKTLRSCRIVLMR